MSTAPVLCGIYLAKCGSNIPSALVNEQAKRVFRYVNYFVILHGSSKLMESALRKRVSNAFGEASADISFTCESMKRGVLRLLNPTLQSDEGHVCRWFFPMSKKGLLSSKSAILSS